MAIETITIQSEWTSPDGKVKVYTSPEQHKYYCYKLPLFQHITIGLVSVNLIKRTRKDNSVVDEIINVYTEVGEPVLKETPKEEPKPETPKGQDAKAEVARKTQAGHDYETQRSIEKQAALKCANEFAIAKGIGYNEVPKIAETYDKWLSDGLLVEVSSVEKKSIPPRKVT